MTLTWLGRVALYVAFLATLGGIVHQVIALRTNRPSRSLRWALVSLAGIVGAVAVMQFALITHNFSLAYVSENNATFTPLLYSITGMWSALEGSLLLWSLLLCAIIVVVLYYYRRRSDDPVVSWASVVLFGVSAFFLGLMCGPADPFIHNAARVLQGAGSERAVAGQPARRDPPAAALHGLRRLHGALRLRDRDAHHRSGARPLAAGAASLDGARLGRARRSASCWARGGATRCSAGAASGAGTRSRTRRCCRGSPRRPTSTRSSCRTVADSFACGTCRWRSPRSRSRSSGRSSRARACSQSVHAFSSSTLGPILIGFFFVTVALGVGLLAWRGDRLRSPVGVDHPLSKEGLFIANNVLFVGFAVVVLLGTVFPLLYEAVNGGQVTVGTPYFATVAVPMSIVLLVLMSLAPLVGWRTLDASVLWTRMRFERVDVARRRRRADHRRRAPSDGVAGVLPRDAPPRAPRCARCAARSSRPKRRHQHVVRRAARTERRAGWSCTSASS